MVLLPKQICGTPSFSLIILETGFAFTKFPCGISIFKRFHLNNIVDLRIDYSNKQVRDAVFENQAISFFLQQKTLT